VALSDLFHEQIRLSFILRVVATMNLARWHTYQVLTKRSSRLRDLLSGPLQGAAGEHHIWWGVSVEDRKYGLPRVEDLQATPAAVRFLSIEPLLEDLGTLPLEGISWVIVGGESGPGARPMQENWVLSIREQCETANVPFFFKQWGGVRKKAAGRMLLGRTHDGFPNRVQHPTIPARLRQRHAAEIERGALVQLVVVD
jgi:protein gp37